jgi:hypothetical protein
MHNPRRKFVWGENVLLLKTGGNKSTVYYYLHDDEILTDRRDFFLS